MARKKDSEGMKVDSADWQARATHIRQVLGAAPDTAVAEALGTFLFEDDDDKTWTYNGAAWMSWDGTQWAEGKAPTTLNMQPFLHEPSAAEAAEDAESAAAPEIATAGAATIGTAAALAETPEAAAAEGPVAAGMAAADSPVSKDAILASFAAGDGKTADLDAAKTDSAASDMTATADKPDEAAAATTAAGMSGAASQPASTDSSMSMGAGAAMAAGAASGMGSAGAAGTGSTAAPAMGSSFPAAGSPGMSQPATTAAAVAAAVRRQRPVRRQQRPVRRQQRPVRRQQLHQLLSVPRTPSLRRAWVRGPSRIPASAPSTSSPPGPS